MHLSFRNILLAVVPVFVTFSTTAVRADLKGWAFEKLQQVPEVIGNNSFDPTPKYPYNCEYPWEGEGDVRINRAKIGDLFLADYSANIYTSHVSANLNPSTGQGFIQFSLESDAGPEIRAFHSTNWTVFDQTIHSSGPLITTLNQYQVTCRFYFNELPSGYLGDLNWSLCFASFDWKDVRTIYISNITDHPASDGVIDILARDLADKVFYCANDYGNPVSDLLKEFWAKTLAETTMEELVGHTGTWNPTTVPSTTPVQASGRDTAHDFGKNP